LIVITNAVGLMVFAFVFGSALLAMALRRLLPENHLSPESQDVVKLGIALIATMVALVVSLLLSSAKTSFDARNPEFAQMASIIIFASFGFYAPANLTIVATLGVCALPVAGAIFLILVHQHISFPVDLGTGKPDFTSKS
jgi:hypothetical protein